MTHRTRTDLHANARQILALLRKRVPLRTRDLKAATGLTGSLTLYSLHILHSKGLAENPSRGRWQISARGMAASTVKDIAWIERAIAECDTVVAEMDDENIIGVHLTLAREHFKLALELV